MELGIYDRAVERRFDFFNDVRLSLRYDSVASAFSFSFYFNPENPEHVSLVKPTSWQLAKIYQDGELLLTGFILGIQFGMDATRRLVSISGYSIPGVLEDSQIPTTAYPLQSDNLTLNQIVDKILLPFQIKKAVDDSVASLMDVPYKKTTANATQSVKDYFTELCKQRNIIMSHTAGGRLLFTSAKTSQNPIAHFDGGIGNTEITHTFNGQALHSPITVLRQADKDGGNAGEFTLTNPYIPASTTAFRPKVIVQSSGDSNDTEKACRNALAAELKSIQLKVSITSWYINGQLAKPNSIITIQSEDLFLNKKTKVFIESVDFAGNEKSQTATLNCVLPECYSLDYPKNIYENI
jgi:prophage tail gpP-like protein